MAHDASCSCLKCLAQLRYILFLRNHYYSWIKTISKILEMIHLYNVHHELIIQTEWNLLHDIVNLSQNNITTTPCWKPYACSNRMYSSVNMQITRNHHSLFHPEMNTSFQCHNIWCNIIKCQEIFAKHKAPSKKPIFTGKQSSIDGTKIFPHAFYMTGKLPSLSRPEWTSPIPIHSSGQKVAHGYTGLES